MHRNRMGRHVDLSIYCTTHFTIPSLQKISRIYSLIEVNKSHPARLFLHIPWVNTQHIIERRTKRLSMTEWWILFC
jgi:hypothetical protein